MVGKRKEQAPPPQETRAERFMAARLLEAERLAREYQEQLDPRQR